jgi:hypothetical protein
MSRNVRVQRRAIMAAAFARSVTLPLVLSHARPSFFTLDRGHQRRLLVEQMAGKLGTNIHVAQRIADEWNCTPYEPSPLVEWCNTPFAGATPASRSSKNSHAGGSLHKEEA